MSMGLNLKDDETVALVTEVAARLGTTKTGAVRELARQKLAELDAHGASELEARTADNLRWLEEHIWPYTAGATSPTKEEIEEMLGYDDPLEP